METPHGVIKTKVVLNAAGAWSGAIARMLGLDIPLVPMKHAYIVTEQMDVQGLPNIRDPDFGLYFRVQGGTMSVGGYEPNPIVLKSVSYTRAKVIIPLTEKTLAMQFKKLYTISS